jgi:hypothetical protein
MTRLERFLTGGLGALVPVVLNLVVLDLRVLAESFAPSLLLGALARMAALGIVGGAVACLQADAGRTRLLQLGLGASALLLALLNGSNVKLPVATSPQAYSLAVPVLEVPAFAEEFPSPRGAEGPPPVRQFDLPRPSGIEGFLQGLTGRIPDDLWFVIAGSYAGFEDARRHALAIRHATPRFSPSIYAPFRGSRFYAVVVGEYLPFAGAKARQVEALRAGLPATTHLWTFPRE